MHLQQQKHLLNIYLPTEKNILIDKELNIINTLLQNHLQSIKLLILK